MKKAFKTIELMHLLPNLWDPQSDLVLLQSSIGISKLVFGLITFKENHMKETNILFDKEL